MTEDQTETLEEKEEKRMIRIVEQIDNRLAVQGQSYIKGQLKEALSLAYEIIELAKPEGLNSFVQEQEEFIARIKKLFEEKEERDREKLRAEQERLRLEKIKELKNGLNNLEYSFKAGFDVKDFIKTKETLEKAKNLLSQINEDELNKKWYDLEQSHLEAKKKKELIDKAQKIIAQSIELKEKFLFDELKPKLTDIIKQLKENRIEEHLKELEYINADVLNVEKSYLKVIKTLETFKNEIKNLQEKKDFEKAIIKCDSFIKLAQSVGKTEIVEEYSKTLIILQKDFQFEELKEKVKKLNDDGLELLKRGEISTSLKKYEMIKGTINYYLKEH
ncbi:MAG: hypothetical protein ACFFA4_15170 [Promethearchaeota archaeon]